LNDEKTELDRLKIVLSKEKFFFTGLKDKNGKEIYEGDIVKFENTPSVVVEWYQKNANFVGKIIETLKEEYPTYCSFFGFTLYRNPEVIGNIFENPELLEHD